MRTLINDLAECVCLSRNKFSLPASFVEAANVAAVRRSSVSLAYLMPDSPATAARNDRL